MARNGHAARAGAGVDPLIGALLAKLPAAGTAWPREQQVAWLRMLAMALEVTYPGGEGLASALELPAFLPAKAAAAMQPASAPEPPRPPAKPRPPFVIDLQGHARNERGEPVLPEDVNDIMVDERGELGDLAAIVWADGTTGIPKGMQLDISTSG